MTSDATPWIRANAEGRVGRTVAAKYRLDELLGCGGAGAVYRATHLITERVVAAKLLHAHLITSHESSVRFLRQARAATIASHTHVCEVLDAGKEADSVYVVMELLDGLTLAEQLASGGGTLPWGAVLDLLLPVVDALGTAHARQIVHRDLQPSNVILARIDGRIVPKLVDFGLARVAEPPSTPRLTQPGTAIGTAPYVAPEQITDAAGADARADVWSLGVVLYEMLAGRPPYTSADLLALGAEIRDAPPAPLSSLAADAPPELSAIVHRCLSVDAAARHRSAQELASALRHVRADYELGATGTSLSRLSFEQIMALAGGRGRRE